MVGSLPAWTLDRFAARPYMSADPLRLLAGPPAELPNALRCPP